MSKMLAASTASLRARTPTHALRRPRPGETFFLVAMIVLRAAAPHWF